MATVGTRGKRFPRRGRKADPAAPGSAAAAKTGPTVLVVGTDDWAVEQAAALLTEAGSPVLTCHDSGRPAFPCNALLDDRTCPLDVGFDVVATVRARASATPAPGEFGVICGLRAGASLVVAGIAQDRPFGPWTAVTVGQNEDLATACREVAARAAAARLPLPKARDSKAHEGVR